MKDNKTLSKDQEKEIIEKLKTRFEENMNRHEELVWSHMESRLNQSPVALWSLYEMERTGGEPDVVAYDEEKDEYVFFDCAEESPIGRRSLCYDKEALEARKKNKPKDSALNLAEIMGIELLTEKQYRKLQELGDFDTKTSSWIKTPDRIRKLGGALYCDRRYDTVFVYHNGAESYYASRGFRGSLRV